MSSFSRTSSSPLALAEAARERLRTRRLGRRMEGHAALGSTNERALAWARDGAPEGSTVVTDYQTNGRGRHGRGWQAQSGQSLTFSVVLRPSDADGRVALPVRRRGLVALAGGLAVCDAVAGAVAAPAPQLKWPNDVLLRGRKCCGVLVETVFTGSAPGPLVLGVGLNVGRRAFPDVPDGATPPTSLALAAGRLVERAPLLAQVLGCLEARYFSLFEDGGRTVRAACTERLAALGERVAVRHAPSGERIEGTFTGLAPDGAMRLQTGAGAERLLYAGEVTTR